MLAFFLLREIFLWKVPFHLRKKPQRNAQMMREGAQRTGDEVGDGTSTMG